MHRKTVQWKKNLGYQFKFPRQTLHREMNYPGPEYLWFGNLKFFICIIQKYAAIGHYFVPLNLVS